MKFSIWRTYENRVYIESEDALDWFTASDFSRSGLLPQFERNIANDQARTLASMVNWMLEQLGMPYDVVEHPNPQIMTGGASQLIAEYTIYESADAEQAAA